MVRDDFTLQFRARDVANRKFTLCLEGMGKLGESDVISSPSIRFDANQIACNRVRRPSDML